MILLAMNTESNPFIIGLTSGLVSSILASIIIWFFYKIIKGYLIPKYKEAIYNGIEIDGKWENEIRNPESGRGAEGFMELQQSGTKLYGELVLKHTRENQNDRNIIYKLNGEIINDLVFLHGIPKDRQKKSFSAGLFTIMDGGKSLHGCSFGTDNYTSQIFTRDNIVWHRE